MKERLYPMVDVYLITARCNRGDVREMDLLILREKFLEENRLWLIELVGIRPILDHRAIVPILSRTLQPGSIVQ